MSGTKDVAHTPGPWATATYASVVDQSITADIRSASNGRRVAVIETANTPNWLANANLLAAAPDLLEAVDPDALDVIAANLEGAGIYYEQCIFLRSLASRQRAAVAKAKGVGG